MREFSILLQKYEKILSILSRNLFFVINGQIQKKTEFESPKFLTGQRHFLSNDITMNHIYHWRIHQKDESK
jgi:hypothetical protein